MISLEPLFDSRRGVFLAVEYYWGLKTATNWSRFCSVDSKGRKGGGEMTVKDNRTAHRLWGVVRKERNTHA
jgi:hypothetical protein